MTLGSLYIDVQGHVLALLKNLHGMSCSGTYWLLGVGMEAVDDLLLINVPCSQEFSGVLCFGLKPLASGFQSYSSLASRLLHPYSSDKKNL